MIPLRRCVVGITVLRRHAPRLLARSCICARRNTPGRKMMYRTAIASSLSVSAASAECGAYGSAGFSVERYVRHHKRWQRYEKSQRGHQVQLTVKLIAPLNRARKTHYQFTAIDEFMGLRVLCLYDQLGQKTAVQFVDDALEKVRFHVLRMQTDKGSQFRAALHCLCSTAASTTSTTGQRLHGPAARSSDARRIDAGSPTACWTASSWMTRTEYQSSRSGTASTTTSAPTDRLAARPA